MLSSGDVVRLDLGAPAGSEAGLVRPAVVVTAQRVLVQRPTVVQVVPLTKTIRSYDSEITVVADRGNGLDANSAAQCQHIRAIAMERVLGGLGNVGPGTLAQIREAIGVLLDL